MRITNLKRMKENRQQIEDRFFRRQKPYYIRIRDGYKFNGEEVDLSIDYYFETGNEP